MNPALNGTSRTPLYVATGNRGKLREMEALFAGTRFAPMLFAGYVSPAEGDASYADNAALKARTLRKALDAAGIWGDVLADDSGLEVYALDRRPGVTTAEYGGTGASWPERRAKLLGELSGVAAPDRGARFVCLLHYVGADGREYGSLGTVEGAIAPEERGALGFSFDPVFLFPPAGRTFAELQDAEKNRVSHRAVAVAAIVAAIEAGARTLTTGMREA